MSDVKSKTPPTSAFSRSLKLFGMASKLAATEVMNRVSGAGGKKSDELTSDQVKRRVQQAKIITDSLSQLKGAAMKAGQLLSIDASGFLPQEALDVLAKLQGQSVQMDFALVEKQLRKELGFEKFSELKNLSYRAVAAASIGQVHSAQLNGQKVAVKVQYPGIAESIDSDVRILKRIVNQLIGLSDKEVATDEVFAELQRVLELEANYTYEAKQMKIFKEAIAFDHRFIVPSVFESHSTSRILTMSYEEGSTLTDWLNSSPSLEDREKVARMVLDLFVYEFQELGLVQTDPNFANFLVQEDPLKLVLLDFGAALEYSQEFRREYSEMLNEITSGDPKRIFDAAVRFELIDPREDETTQRSFQEMLTVSMRPFLNEYQPFDFSDVDFEKQSRDTAIAFSRSLKYSAPPKKIIFLHRKLGGIFNLLKRMNIKMDLAPYWSKMLGHK